MAGFFKCREEGKGTCMASRFPGPLFWRFHISNLVRIEFRWSDSMNVVVMDWVMTTLCGWWGAYVGRFSGVEGSGWLAGGTCHAQPRDEFVRMRSQWVELWFWKNGEVVLDSWGFGGEFDVKFAMESVVGVVRFVG